MDTSDARYATGPGKSPVEKTIATHAAVTEKSPARNAVGLENRKNVAT
jgi:hypothetical protein